MPRKAFDDFSLELPDTWTLQTMILAGPKEESPEDAAFPTAQAPPGFRENLVLTRELVGPDETPESYVRRQLFELVVKAGMSRREGASPEPVRLASGLDGLLTEQVVHSPTGERVRQMQLVCIKNGVAITAIISQLDGPPFQRARASFRTMLLSLE
jgi:hypothetical protein